MVSLFMHCLVLFMHYLALFMHCSRIKNIKNGSHDTIYTIKNYFATVFSVFSFQFSVFSNNKLNPNGPLVFITIPILINLVNSNFEFGLLTQSSAALTYHNPMSQASFIRAVLNCWCTWIKLKRSEESRSL